MLHFGAVRLDSNASGLTLKKESTRSQWHKQAVLEGNTKLGTVKQAPNATTDVRFFKGKGGFAAIVTTNDLRFIALPGSHIELPDTILDLPGTEIPASATPASALLNQVSGPVQKVTDQAMILGAGLATRFEPVSGDSTGFPKPGVPLVGNDSVIVNIARQLERHGIRKIVVNTFYMPDVIKKQLQQDVPNVQFIFVDENKPSGTAGGLVKGLENGAVDQGKPILIVQGDAVTDADFSHLLNAHDQNKAKITIGVQPVGDDELSNVAILKTDRAGSDGESGRILDYVEKPGKDPLLMQRVGNARLGSIGFYVLAPEVYKEFETQGKQAFAQGNIFDYAMDFFPSQLNRADVKMWAEKVAGYWGDIGNPKQYVSTVKDILAGKLKLPMPQNLKDYYDQGAIFWPGAKQLAEQEKAQVRGNVIAAKKPEIIA